MGDIKKSIVEAMRELGLDGQVVCVHASMRSFTSRVDAQDVIDCFLGEECTLVVPTFTYFYEHTAPEKDRPLRNGTDYVNRRPVTKEFYQKDDNTISSDEMGQFSTVLLGNPDRVRGDHPLNSFAALGPMASKLIEGQTPQSVFEPFRRLVDLNGKILMMGTSLTSMAFIHFVEMMIGRNLFVRWAKDSEGRLIATRVGGCSSGFANLATYLDRVRATRVCLGSTWQCYDAGSTLKVLIRVLVENPERTFCNNPLCLRCHDAISGGPIV